MKIILTWLNYQFEFLKGFFMEVQSNGQNKPSMKRLVSFMVAFTFLRTYGSTLSKKLESITNIDAFAFPDVPEVWALLIGGIIGLNIVSNYVDKMKNKKDSDN